MKYKQILIVHQDELSTRSLSSYFQSLGYEIESAKGVSETIRKIRNGKIRILLLDEEIEEVKATEMVVIFKKINPKLQIIVISSQVSVESAKRLRAAGIFYQAMKPIDPEEVRSAVECAVMKLTREQIRQEGFFPILTPPLVTA